MNFIGRAKVLLFVRIAVAAWLIVRAVIALATLVIVLHNSSFDVIYSSSNLIIFSSILSGGAFFGTAIGILKSKRWAIYAFIGIVLLSYVSQFAFGTFKIDFGELALDLFEIFLIFYLWQNRDKFEVGDKKKEDIFLGLSILAFAVSIILSGFLVDKLNKFLDLDEEAQSPGTLDWQTYRNEEFGFEVKYPPNFEFGVCAGTPPFSVIGLDRSELIQQGSVGCDIGLKIYGIIFTFKEGPYDTAQDVVDSLPLGLDDEIGSTADIFFGRNKFIRVTRFSSFSGTEDIFYFTQYPGSSFFLSVSVYPRVEIDPERDSLINYDEVANQILSTFRFIE